MKISTVHINTLGKVVVPQSHAKQVIVEGDNGERYLIEFKDGALQIESNNLVKQTRSTK